MFGESEVRASQLRVLPLSPGPKYGAQNNSKVENHLSITGKALKYMHVVRSSSMTRDKTQVKHNKTEWQSEPKSA